MQKELDELAAFIRDAEPEYLLAVLWWIQNSGARHLIASCEPDDEALQAIEDRVASEYPYLFEFAVTHKP